MNIFAGSKIWDGYNLMVNCGNEITGNILSATKNRIKPFQITLSIILQNGKRINFINSEQQCLP